MHDLYGLLYILACVAFAVAVLVTLIRRAPNTPIDLFRLFLAAGLLCWVLVATIAFLRA